VPRARGSRLLQLLIPALLLLGLLGAPRVVVDGQRAFALPQGHALPEIGALLDARTGGDDLVAIVVSDESGDAHGLLDADGVLAIETLRQGLAATPAISSVRAVTSAPLLADREGTITAIRPLSPPPSDEAGWDEARRAVLADDFVRGQLIAADGRLALIVGWIERGGPDAILVARASGALSSDAFRASEAGQAIQSAVNGARMDVALGRAEGPVEAEIVRRIEVIAEGGGPGGGLVAGWLAERSDDPERLARVAIDQLVADFEPPPGLRVGATGASIVEAALQAVVPRAVGWSLLGLALLGGLLGAALRPDDRLRAALAVAGGALVGFVATVGAFGLFGVPLHTWTALAALLGAAWAAALLAATAAGSPPRPGAVLLVGLAGALPWVVGLGPSAGGAAAAIAFAAGCLAAAGGSGLFPAEERSSAPDWTPRWWTSQLAALALVGGLFVLRGAPVGLDAGALLSASHPVGRATSDAADRLGVVPSAFLVCRAPDLERPMANPAMLRSLGTVQRSIEHADGVRGSRSWTDFVAALHRRVAGAQEGALPDSADLVEQYLLMFGQRSETRVLVDDGLDMGVGFVQLERGGGAHLGALAETWPADEGPVALAGDGVEMALAGRIAGRGMLRGGAVGLALLLAMLAVAGIGWRRGARTTVTDGLLVAAVGAVALALGSSLPGAITPTVCGAAAAAMAMAALSCLLPIRAAFATLAILGAGLAPMALFPSVELQAAAIALSGSCGLAVLIRLGYVCPRPADHVREDRPRRLA
jgi:hypothetical protein